MFIWTITLAANISLALWLLWLRYHEKYRVLFASFVFQCFMTPLVHFVYIHYGTNSSAYFQAFWLEKAIVAMFCVGVIFEGFAWRNRCIRIPAEAYLLAILILAVTQKSEHGWIVHLVNQTMRYINLTIFGWYFYCLRGTYERRDFGQNRLPR